MKTKVKGIMLAMLMSLAMAFVIAPMMGEIVYADPEDPTYDGVRYSLHDDGTATVVGYTNGLPANIVFPETVDGHTVTSIGEQAFDNYKGTLTSITIPKTVKSIGLYAFYGTGLTSVSFDENSELTYIGISAFSGCSNLESITIPKKVTTIDGGAFSSSGLKTVIFEDGTELKSIKGYAFEYCGNLTSITIPDGVTTIGAAAFNGCSSLTSVTIPDGVTTIRDYAFNGCSRLASVSIPDGVTVIQAEAFNGCGSLASVTIPNGVTAIHNKAFAGSANPLTVYYMGTVKQWERIPKRNDWAEGRNITVKYLVIAPTGKTLTYNGEEQTGVEAGEGYRLTNASATDADSYEAIATLKDGYIWADDGTTAPRAIPWTIDKATAKVTEPATKTFTYNGKEQVYAMDGANYTLSGTTKATKAGTYTAKATLNTDDNYIYKWSDGTTAPKNVTWKINKATVKVTPPSGKTYTYNGKAKSFVVTGAKYSLSGTTKATKAGTYVAKATLNTDANYTYKWSDGTTAAKSIKWTINKAANPLTIKAKTATVKYSAVKKKAQTLAVGKVITFTKKGQGKLTYTKVSGNRNITINKTTGKVTVKKGLKKGTYKVKIKVKAAGNANYKASTVKTVTFKVRVK